MVVKIGIIVIFICVVIAIGIYARKHTKSVDGFVLGGRSVGPWLSAFAFGTSYFSAVIFIGYAGQFGWKYGLSAFWIGVGNALLGSLLAWWVLGPRTREITQRLKATTMPEFFGKRRNNFVQRVRNAYGYAFGMFVVVAEEFSAVEYVGAQFAVAPVVIQ